VNFLADIFGTIGGYLWGWPESFPLMIVLLLGTGVIITIRMKFIQLRRVKHAIDITRGKYDNPEHEGDISHFQALSTALSATIGIGNIAGVATGIYYGGPGALFWMWVTGLLGTSLKYAECTLSMKFRKINPDGSASGGPMYYIEKAMGWKWLAIIFAASASICALATGNSIQAFTVADQLNADFAVPVWLTGAILALFVGAVIIGGIRRIGKVTQVLTPFMTVVYVISTLTIIILHIDRVPAAFEAIVTGAFSPPGAVGGFVGSTFMLTLIWGIKRGLFSNEAGQGSAPIAHAAAKTDEPVREGTVAMMGPYIDTLLVCTLTGLCIIITNAWTVVVDGERLNSSVMTAYAFSEGLHFLGGYGGYIVTAAVLLFASSTIIGWSYYGDRSIQYLFGNMVVMPYRYLYCFMIFVGAITKLEVVWAFGDIGLGMMAIPNLIALIALSGVTARMTNEYFSRKHVPLR